MHRKLSAFPLCCVGNHYTLYFLSVFSVILSTYVVIFWFVSGSVVALLSSWAIPPARCMAMLLYSGQCPADGIQLCCDRQTLSFSFTVYCVLRLLLLLLTYPILGWLKFSPILRSLGLWEAVFYAHLSFSLHLGVFLSTRQGFYEINYG